MSLRSRGLPPVEDAWGGRCLLGKRAPTYCTGMLWKEGRKRRGKGSRGCQRKERLVRVLSSCLPPPSLSFQTHQGTDPILSSSLSSFCLGTPAVLCPVGESPPMLHRVVSVCRARAPRGPSAPR